VEGIETEEQEKHLLALGCDSGQGYFYARPMPVKEFYEEFLPKHS
jgi:EAL domain-containing protein (putative c-di-GMP-specific phosphodiesterase class I)